ncbi:class I SAM-dependent methyltransferase [Enterococcus timonensis]|uniref:class I SAM-dependent methyltransferase n=1 Tax=Enterococcus timonensis TaxID=1852364 RepID=UPI0008DAD3D9|nr:class I SAM-dependent methyltransferase [Enterococcus timonensis]
MGDHYFTKNPNVEHNETTFTYTLKNRQLHFTTDAGVFSKSTIDFGSRLLIETFSPDNLLQGPLLDVGCGYGPIGLSLAPDFPLVEMIDVNERAVNLAVKNASANQISNVEIHLSNIYQELHEQEFAAIVSNPPVRAGKSVVHEILSGAYDLLKTGGTLTIVLQKKQGAPSAEKKMLEVFGNVQVLKKDKGYYILQSIKQ